MSLFSTQANRPLTSRSLREVMWLLRAIPLTCWRRCDANLAESSLSFTAETPWGNARLTGVFASTALGEVTSACIQIDDQMLFVDADRETSTGKGKVFRLFARIYYTKEAQWREQHAAYRCEQSSRSAHFNG